MKELGAVSLKFIFLKKIIIKSVRGNRSEVFVFSLIGMPFSFEADKSNMIICNTTGSLVAGVAWGLDDHGNVLVPAMSRQTGHQLG